MKLSAVVPVWNGREYLELLLATIAAQTLPFNEIVVVDNGSSDGAAELASQRGARVVRFAKNRGFAAAVNRGVSESGGDLIAVLNSDVELAQDWAELLSQSISNRSVYFATGRILSKSNPAHIDGTWDLVSKAGMPWRAGSGADARHPEFLRGRPVKLASFTSILFRRELWDRVGPLDERFESYLEDVDFGLRCATLQLGGYYRAEAVCFHHGSASLGAWNPETVRRMSRNQVFLVRKYKAPSWWNVFIGQTLWGIIAARHGAGWAWFQGKVEGISRNLEHHHARASLAEQEDEIFKLQARIGFDSYWRWYGRLTGAKLRLNDTGSARE